MEIATVNKYKTPLIIVSSILLILFIVFSLIYTSVNNDKYYKALKSQLDSVKLDQKRIDTLNKRIDSINTRINSTENKIATKVVSYTKIKQNYEKDSIAINNYSPDSLTSFISRELSKRK